MARESGGDRVVAFFDIGSNAVRYLCARVPAAGTPEIIDLGREQTRLGEDAFTDGSLSPEAVARAMRVCGRFVERARAAGAGDFVAVATAAVREAADRDEFCRRLGRECDLDVRVLSGDEEAEAIFRGVSRRVGSWEGTLLCIDVGGGSTEVSLGERGGTVICQSLPVGAVRLGDALLPKGVDGPIDEARYALLCAEVRQAAALFLAGARGRRIDVACATGGTARTLITVATAVLPARRHRAADVLWRGDMDEVIEMLRTEPLDRRRRFPGLDPERADIIVPGAAVLDTLMCELRLESLYLPDFLFVRDVLLAEYAEGGGRARA